MGKSRCALCFWKIIRSREDNLCSAPSSLPRSCVLPRHNVCPEQAHFSAAVKTLTAAQRSELRDKAKAAFDVVSPRRRRAPCAPTSRWSDGAPVSPALSPLQTTAYKNYLRALRTLLLTPKPEEAGDSGMQRWYADNTRDFDAAARAWSAYRTAQCQSEATTVEPGSGMPETQANCLLALLKDRVQRMSDVYGQMAGLNAANKVTHCIAPLISRKPRRGPGTIAVTKIPSHRGA